MGNVFHSTTESAAKLHKQPQPHRNMRIKTISVVYITFSINCVLESMRKSLKTECKRLSVAFVSRIRLSNCFSISCVFDSILWEKSWRKRKSWKNIWEKNIQMNKGTALKWQLGWKNKDILELDEEVQTYPRVGCQGPVCTVLSHLLEGPGSLPHLSIFLWARAICDSLRQPAHLQPDHSLVLMQVNDSEMLLKSC